MKTLLPLLCILESLVVPEVTTSSGPSSKCATFSLSVGILYINDSCVARDASGSTLHQECTHMRFHTQ